jgi:Rrf2 family protein
MRVSAHADYALRAAIELAAAPGHPVTGEHLARAQVIPGRFLETILLHLRRGNIVHSKRGPDGGFWLARPASEISLADVIRAVDGQLLRLDGEPPEDVTYPGAAEPLRRAWIALRAFGPTVLETVTLADIISGELWLPGRPRCRSPAAPSASRARTWPPGSTRWRARPGKAKREKRRAPRPVPGEPAALRRLLLLSLLSGEQANEGAALVAIIWRMDERRGRPGTGAGLWLARAHHASGTCRGGEARGRRRSARLPAGGCPGAAP